MPVPSTTGRFIGRPPGWIAAETGEDVRTDKRPCEMVTIEMRSPRDRMAWRGLDPHKRASVTRTCTARLLSDEPGEIIPPKARGCAILLMRCLLMLAKGDYTTRGVRPG